MKQHFDWGGRVPLGPLLGYTLAPFLTEKKQASHAEIMPVTQKLLIIIDFLVKFCFIQN